MKKASVVFKDLNIRVLSKEFWLPTCSGLSLLDYYVWGVTARVSNKSRHPSVVTLKSVFIRCSQICTRSLENMFALQKKDRGSKHRKRACTK